MTPVKQINGYTCFLACIESFLRDKGKPKTQADMIKELEQKALCDANGWVPFDKLGDACLALGIDLSDVPYQFPPNTMYADGSLLIGTHIPGNHVVRFCRQEGQDKIVVMDPSEGKLMIYDRTYLEPKNPEFHRIMLSKPLPAVAQDGPDQTDSLPLAFGRE
jgi:hypothetical protein